MHEHRKVNHTFQSNIPMLLGNYVKKLMKVIPFDEHMQREYFFIFVFD